MKPILQQDLHDFVQTLVRAYGWRPDFESHELPNRVPYIPLPFAGLMVDHFASRAEALLRAGGDNIQPNFIRNRISEARYLVGEIRPGGEVTRSNADSFEQAPPMVALKAPIAALHIRIPGVLQPSATRPSGWVMKAPATWKLLDALVRLARHIDILADAPTMQGIWGASLSEATDEALNAAARGAEKAYEVAGSAVHSLANLPTPSSIMDTLKTAALVAGGLALLVVVLK